MEEHQKSAETIVAEKLWKHNRGKGRIIRARDSYFKVVKAKDAEKTKGHQRATVADEL